jgi:membrane AbrB-like protein
VSFLPAFLHFNPQLAFGAALTLLLGTLGAVIFDWLTMPLAWLIGAMIITTIAALSGAPLKPPGRLRDIMIGVLGIMLGCSFTPDIINNASQWWQSILTLLIFIVTLAVAVAVFLNRVAHFDPVTAYFSAAPGSFATMAILGAEMGGDERNISLIHSIRIMLTVLVIPFWFRFYHGYVPSGSEGQMILGSIFNFPLNDFLILATCSLGYPLAKLLKCPASALLGPMFLSAIAHLTGLTSATPPSEIINLSQLVIGTGLGCRFVGIRVKQVLRNVLLSICVTLFMLSLAAGFAFGLEQLIGLPFTGLWLAFAPGGLAEMTLISLAMNTDTAFVSTHHLIRMMFLVFVTPLVFSLIRERLIAKPKV